MVRALDCEDGAINVFFIDKSRDFFHYILRIFCELCRVELHERVDCLESAHVDLNLDLVKEFSQLVGQVEKVCERNLPLGTFS